MEDISLHILDIVENSIAAGAKNIEIKINEQIQEDLLTIEIIDDGKGIEEEDLKHVLDPFFTTRGTRRVGLGLPLLAQSAEESGGNLKIESKPGYMTKVEATFGYSHIDRKPFGDMVETLITLIATQGLKVDFLYEHRKNNHGFVFDTKSIKKELKDIPLNNMEVINYLRDNLKKEFRKLDERSNK